MTPKPKTKGMDLAKIERGVRLILEGAGEDPHRPDLRGTPQRVARMYAEILGGLHENPEAHLRCVHEEKHDEMVLIKNIPAVLDVRASHAAVRRGGPRRLHPQGRADRRPLENRPGG